MNADKLAKVVAMMDALQAVRKSLSETTVRNNEPAPLRNVWIGFDVDPGYQQDWNQNKDKMIEFLDLVDEVFEREGQ